MNAEQRRRLKDGYKSKQTVGGVYAIICSGNQHRLVKSSVDIGGIKNRFGFAQAIKSCPDPAVRGEWTQYGPDSLSLVVLEELQKKEDQTDREFAEEVELLREMWLDKAAQGGD